MSEPVYIPVYDVFVNATGGGVFIFEEYISNAPHHSNFITLPEAHLAARLRLFQYFTSRKF